MIRWPSFPIHDVKQRSVVRSRGALLRPGFSAFSHVPSPSRRRRAHEALAPAAVATAAIPSPPMRGGWSADRRTLSFGRACGARPPCPGATGTSLGAPPWRFSDADPRSRLPAAGPEPPATARAKPSGLAVGVRTSLRCGSRRVRGTPLPAPPSGSSPETPPHERGWRLLYINFDL
jgi:hypothetical protein